MTNFVESDTDEQRRELAAAFGHPIDPLAAAEDGFVETGIDPFALFRTEVLSPRDLAPLTMRQFEMIFDEWREHMSRQGRHPACPNPDHVEAYIRWQTTPESEGGRGNANQTTKEKLRKLNQAYRYWQQDVAFPHPDGYNPIYLARERVPLPIKKEKEHRRIPISELQTMVQSVSNLRTRTVIVLQLKLGLRAGEVANI
jgi:integrase/recombinase XerD